jgi:urease accessory protein
MPTTAVETEVAPAPARPRESGDPALDSRFRGNERAISQFDLTASNSSDNRKISGANRATGLIDLAVASRGAKTVRTRVHENGSLRVRFPNVAAGPLETVIINTAGGMTGGDEFAIRLQLGPDANLLAGTAAAEKIYRSTGPDAVVAIGVDAAPGSRCLWLPQETILFDRARLSRRIDINLAGDASLLMAEAVVFGRSAMGEVVHEGRLIDRWRVRRDGRLIFADTVRLDGPINEQLAQPALAAGGIAIATVLMTPADETRIAALREIRFQGEVGLSAWNGIALARLCAAGGAALRQDLITILSALCARVPSLWLQ